MTDILQPTALHLQEHWQSASLSPNTVVRAFKRMWTEIAAERREGNRLSKQIAADAMVRTQTINLVALADSESDLVQAGEMIHNLSEFIPSRIILLLDNHGWDDDLDITAEVEEHPRPLPLSPTRLEMVTVRARRQQLASVALPLLVPELPDYVWCSSGTFVDNELVTDLAPFSDRIIVDSSLVAESGAALRYLSRLVDESGSNVRIGDFAWTRLILWRQMIAQFFDTHDALLCLSNVDEVIIEYGEHSGSGRSATTSGLMVAGWLATRLGWRSPGEGLVRSRDGWKLTLRAGERGRSREVVLVLRPVWTDEPTPSLVSVQMNAGDVSPGSFTVRRTSPETIVTISELPDQAPVERTAYSLIQEDGQLLSTELRMSGHDQIYVEALAFASRLWPDGENSQR